MATEPMALEGSAERIGHREGVGGLTLGVISILLGWTPIIGLACGIVGLALSVKGRSKSADAGYRGLGIAGMVTSIIGISWGTISTLLWLAAAISAGYFVWTYPYRV